MSVWTFFGEIRPERYPVSWGQPLKGHLSQADFGVEADFSTFVHVGQVVVTLKITKGSADLASLRNIALDCAYQVSDVVGYISGCVFDVDIISACCPDTGESHVFGVQIPALAMRKNPHRRPEIDSDLFLTVSASIPAQMVLRDLQLAMRDAIGTGFYCYRAVEAMMQSMKNDTIKTDKQAWERLNESLLLDRSASEKIKRHADHPRDGKPSSMSDQERGEVFQLADEIVYRFLEYLRRDVGPLPFGEFQMLRG
ncbi:hypothetical protein [Bradyrhizobium cenepequi]|uniref:hypothetical protein n=1 Tax=Bradyrhizobium cenepequi TaxID=2821403 RepID=UPI001CE3078D|nr:hypothetical protein [Bradyrhizobium cenepequi]MCA6112896.1 hypothetical protein [Bradyrhizobium cenepequi]